MFSSHNDTCTWSSDRGKTKGLLVTDMSEEPPVNLKHNPFPEAKMFFLCVQNGLKHSGHSLTRTWRLVKHFCGVKANNGASATPAQMFDLRGGSDMIRLWKPGPSPSSLLHFLLSNDSCYYYFHSNTGTFLAFTSACQIFRRTHHNMDAVTKCFALFQLGDLHP